jgi:hypothetical protein
MIVDIVPSKIRMMELIQLRDMGLITDDQLESVAFQLITPYNVEELCDFFPRELLCNLVTTCKWIPKFQKFNLNLIYFVRSAGDTNESYRWSVVNKERRFIKGFHTFKDYVERVLIEKGLS